MGQLRIVGHMGHGLHKMTHFHLCHCARTKIGQNATSIRPSHFTYVVLLYSSNWCFRCNGETRTHAMNAGE